MISEMITIVFVETTCRPATGKRIAFFIIKIELVVSGVCVVRFL